MELERERESKRIFFKKQKLKNYYINPSIYVTEGLSNISVAELCFVSPKSLKGYLTEIYKHFKIISRAQLIVLTYRGIYEKDIQKIVNVTHPLKNLALPTSQGSSLY